MFAGLLLFIFSMSLISYLPQTIRSFRLRDPAGLSPTSLLMGFANYALWNIFYYYENAQGLLLMNGATTAVYVLLIVATLYAGVSYKSALLPVGAYSLAVVLLFFFWPPSVGVVLLAGAAWYFIAAAIEVVRAESVEGVAVSSWLLMMAYGLAYSFTWFFGSPWASWLWGLMAVAASLFMLTIVIAKRLEERAKTVQAPV